MHFVITKPHAKFRKPRPNMFGDIVYRKLSGGGEDEEEDTHPGSQNRHFLTVIKTEPKRILTCGKRHSRLEAMNV